MQNELLWILELFVNFGAILLAYRFFGKIGLFLWVPISIILANVQVLKAVELFGMTATLGNIVYATSFLVTDILSENYGRKEARKAVFAGFFSLLTATLIMNLSLHFRPAAADFAHESLSVIFGLLPRIAAASFAAYLVSQLHDVWAYHFWRRRFPATRHIWIRNNASTMVSQLLDTVVFTFGAFLGVFEGEVLMDIFWTTYLLKWIVAAADTPLVYLARSWKDRGWIPDDGAAAEQKHDGP